MGFPSGSVVKNPPANAAAEGDVISVPGWGRSPGEGNGNSLQYSCLEIPQTEEPGGLQSMGSQTAEHGLKRLSTYACTHIKYVSYIKRHSSFFFF